ncbi:polysaccharide deacetylase family protein [Shimia abyssi]|uniref:Chitooligosaccharide deacetylase n=1 Tax=Shimia abyssi TaxID=1662395 RepID=A0A2P8FEJ5_9RHOB|nr:polysaccharide deacetylase family protein [Shimia abyssi]PSL20155.1 polysaccharide deacetylase [Shimia abyssi]
MTRTSARAPVTVVMYHYVRPLADSPFPRLKALELADFHTQLDYLSAHYSVISPAAFHAALHNGADLPNRPCLLTFDDGYSDHYDHVFPALQDRAMTGLFFTPYMSLIKRQMLEVNKVQFILACCEHSDRLARKLDSYLEMEGYDDIASLRQEFGAANRFDDPDVAYFKRMLQHALPAPLRAKIIASLFEEHVSTDVTAFAETLYLTPDQARDMRATGNEFGAHGDLHLWHAKASAEQLAQEVSGSVRALETIGAPVQGGFYCYPFGSENNTVRCAVQQAGFTTGFTVVPDLYTPSADSALSVSRLDTIDLPRSVDAVNDPWLAKATVP